MIISTNEIKQQQFSKIKPELIQQACKLILKYNGEFSYFDIGRVLAGSPNTEDQAAMLLALSTVCHNIPYYENGERKLRELNECLKDILPFYGANKAEGEIIFVSNDTELVDWLTGFKLPALSYGDDTHHVFRSGTGTSKPDLVDANGVTYEVKRNYENGSRASLHKADYLIDCKNTTIEVRKIEADGSIDFVSYPVARFNGVLSEKISTIIQADSLIKTGCHKQIMACLNSGELIPEVERLLADKYFQWNP